MNIINKIQNLFKKDELFGQWHTEDGSGFMIVMGSWMELRKDGTGTYKTWSIGDDETSYNYKGDFIWERIAENRINIQEKDSEKTEMIEYKIIIINGREELTSKQKQMGSVKLKAFWHFAQIMFRLK